MSSWNTSTNTSRTSRSISATTLVSALCLLVLLSLVTSNLSPLSSPHRDLTWLDYDHDAESLVEATRVPKIISYEADNSRTDVHTFRDGEVIVGADARRHPVLHILENFNSEWDLLLDAHGGDQERALLQYQYRHMGGTRPASEVADSHIPISTSLDLFSPISIFLLESRQREVEILPDTFTLTLRSGIPHVTYGNLTASVSEEQRTRRADYLLNAIQPFARSLPDLSATFSLSSIPRHALPFQAFDTLAALAADQPLPHSPVKFRSQAESTGMGARQGRSIHADDLVLLEGPMTRQEHWNWENACRTKSDTEEVFEDEEQSNELPPPIRFVASPTARSDPCTYRALTELHPFYESSDATYHTRLSPIISDATAPWASDVLVPPLEIFAPRYAEGALVVPWDNKTSGLFWLGDTSSSHASHPAKRLQRMFGLAAGSNGHELVLPTDKEGFKIDRKLLSEVMTFDVQPGDENDARQAETKWKFLVDVGEGARMQQRMASGGLVFRPVLLDDWVSRRSVPWIHYVPVQPDLSDLPSLIVFFEQHDALARRIAEAGQTWAREHLNEERARESMKEVLEGFAGLGIGLRGQR